MAKTSGIFFFACAITFENTEVILLQQLMESVVLVTGVASFTTWRGSRILRGFPVKEPIDYDDSDYDKNNWRSL